MFLQDGKTPLHRAAYLGREEAVRMLLEAGADREAKNNVSRTVDLPGAIARLWEALHPRTSWWGI